MDISKEATKRRIHELPKVHDHVQLAAENGLTKSNSAMHVPKKHSPRQEVLEDHSISSRTR